MSSYSEQEALSSISTRQGLETKEYSQGRKIRRQTGFCGNHNRARFLEAISRRSPKPATSKPYADIQITYICMYCERDMNLGSAI